MNIAINIQSVKYLSKNESFLVIVDILAYTFLFAVIGIIVAWVMGMVKN